jgi:hypothetical protein
MKQFMMAALSALALLCLSACESFKDDSIVDLPPPPTNRIEYLLPDDDNDKLIVYGKFPDTKGTVSLAGTPLKIVSWSRNQIICGNVGAAALSGDVIVSSEETQGKRRLYHWLIHYKYKRPHGGTPSNIVETAEGVIIVRGDIIPLPNYVVGGAYPGIVNIGPIEYKTSGTAHSTWNGCNKVKAEWSNTNIKVPLSPWHDDLVGKTRFQAVKQILPNGFDLYIDFQAVGVIPMKLTHTSCNGSTNIEQKMWSSQIDGLDRHDPIPLRFDPNGHIKSDSIETKVYNSTQLIWDFDKGESYGLSWKATRYPLQ